MTATKEVTKTWTKQRKAEERRSRPRSSRQHLYSASRVDFVAAAPSILPGAYEHASGDGEYPVSKRQLYYAARESFLKHTGKDIDYGYFANTLLVQYMNRNPHAESWKVTADPRGTLVIPNDVGEVRIPCGTLAIDDHLEETRRAIDPYAVAAELPCEWPSLAAGVRYQAVLYIEKEGFEPLLKAARIGERYGLAILSCKGQSVVAARRFVDEVCAIGGGVPLLVVHDFDKSGFEISQRLTTASAAAVETDRVSYHFQNKIDVHDLGLRIDDVKKYELAGESCEFRGDFAPDSICTKSEKEFLRSGRRVELNAFTSPQFIDWLESKLDTHLERQFIPDDAILKDAYRRAIVIGKVNDAVRDVARRAVSEAKEVAIPADIRQQVADAMRSERSVEPWDKVLSRLAQSKLNPVGAE